MSLLVAVVVLPVGSVLRITAKTAMCVWEGRGERGEREMGGGAHNRSAKQTGLMSLRIICSRSTQSKNSHFQPWFIKNIPVLGIPVVDRLVVRLHRTPQRGGVAHVSRNAHLCG